MTPVKTVKTVELRTIILSTYVELSMQYIELYYVCIDLTTFLMVMSIVTITPAKDLWLEMTMFDSNLALFAFAAATISVFK